MMGNPLIKEEMELQNKIKDLKMEKNRFSENLYDMQDKIRVKYPTEIKQLEMQIKHNITDLETANKAEFTLNDDNKKIYPIQINGIVYDGRKEGGNAIKTAIGENFTRLSEGKSVDIGEYRGLKLSLQYNSFTKQVVACLSGEKPHYCDLNPTTDIGNITRLDNLIDNISKVIQETEEKISSMQSDLEIMKKDVEKPFPRADELLQAETRLEEVHIELSNFELSDDSGEKDLYERLCDQFTELMSGEVTSIQCQTDNGDVTVEMKNDTLILTDYTSDEVKTEAFTVDYVNEKATPKAFADFADDENGVSLKKSLLVSVDKLLDKLENLNFDVVDDTVRKAAFAR